MKIMYVITKADIGGAQTHLIQLANYFSHKHEVIVAVGSKGPMLNAFNDKVKVIQLEHLKGPILFKEDIFGVKELESLIALIQPDILHLHSSKAGALGRLAQRYAHTTHTKVLFTAHSWAFTEGVNPLKRVAFKLIEKYLLKSTDKVICVSDYDRKLALLNHFDKEKLCTIHNSVAQPKDNVLATIQTKPQQPVEFVMVARFAYPKMHQAVIEAVKLLRESTDQSFNVTFIGDGDTFKENIALAASLGLNDIITFKGNVDHVRAALHQYHVFILMSKHEGLPISIIEAMSEGLPIIASNVGGISELIEDNGILLNQNTPYELAQAMQSFLDTETIQSKARASYKKYEAEFTENKMMKKLERIYEPSY
ncbi:glycosyltransferase family 4 protein [Staphylococcus simulans]|uniref:glycosyltransferase family 4 protein n=1 Tax=Staphylococcus simulans TaxID=1286 RepID=UPI000D037065|nr:glycosyltransferase family 4 protein [Staphylococcus simulans]